MTLGRPQIPAKAGWSGAGMTELPDKPAIYLESALFRPIN